VADRELHPLEIRGVKRTNAGVPVRSVRDRRGPHRRRGAMYREVVSGRRGV
jgi:hypothetical protein